MGDSTTLAAGCTRDTVRLAAAHAAAAALRRLRAPIGFAVVYHRVDERPGDPARELVPAIARPLFEAQVRHLASAYRPVRAGELLEAVHVRRRGGPIPVAVTFDDDLETHVRVAAPVLERAGVPATFFVSGARGRGWWEDLQAAVDERRVSADALGPALAPRLAEALAGRPRALHALAGEIVALAPADRARAASALAAAVDGRVAPPPALSLDDVRNLAARGFEIGFHTRDHEPLPTLDDAALAVATTDGRAAVEQAAGRPVRAFAYPHGRADERVAHAVSRAGFRAAFTTRSEAIGPAGVPLLLGRVTPSSPSPGAFALTAARALGAAVRR